MRRYKIVACILLILSVFGSVHAAPVAVQKVREAFANAVDGSDSVIIGSGKRGDPAEEEGLLQSWGQQQASASENWQSTPWREQGSSSVPNYASGTHPKPSFSSGENKPLLLSTSGGTELSWNPEGEANLIQPGTSTEIQPVASSSKANLIQPASSSMAKSVSFNSKVVLLPSSGIYTELLQVEIIPPSLPGPEGYQPKTAAQSTKPKSKNIFQKLVSKLKFKF